MKKIVLSIVAAISLQASTTLDMVAYFYGEPIRADSSSSFRLIMDTSLNTGGFHGEYLEATTFLQDFGQKRAVEIGATTCKLVGGLKNGGGQADMIQGLVKRAQGLVYDLGANRNKDSVKWLQGKVCSRDNLAEFGTLFSNQYRKASTTAMGAAICSTKPIVKNFTEVEYQFSAFEVDFYSYCETSLLNNDVLNNISNAKFKGVDKYGGQIEAILTKNEKELSLTINYNLYGQGSNGFLARLTAKKEGGDFVIENVELQNVALSIYQSSEKKEALKIVGATKRSLDKQLLIEAINELELFDDAGAIARFVNISTGKDAEFDALLIKKLKEVK